MLRANSKFVEIFTDHNLPGFSISTSSLFITERGEILYADIEVIEKLLELDFIQSSSVMFPLMSPRE